VKPGKDFIGIGVFALIFDENESNFILGYHLPTKKKGSDYSLMWSMPGGTIEFEETAISTLKREIKEETNLDLTKIQFINFTEYIKDGKHWLALNYKACANLEQLKNLEPEKIKEFKKFSVKNIPSNISKDTRACLLALKYKTPDLGK